MPGYRWKPIEPLSEEEREVDLASIKPLYESWRAYKRRLNFEGENQLNDFNTRLMRRLSIETGILEQLYHLDRGTTEVLVAHGFAEDLILRSDADVDPALIVDYLRDQEAAIHLVVDCIANNRDLTKGLIHELHAILTRHQETTDAVDQFGQRLKIRLLRGEYKRQPNNPRRPDGTIHEYCPPVHVDAEMDQLLGWFAEYQAYDPIVVSAWIHHRFTQIHPYQDGNGRLSRVLVTMILLKAGLLPLVIDRDQKASYILALEAADSGDLTKLARGFARLERDAILQALNIDLDTRTAEESHLTSAVIDALSDKFSRRKEQRHQELRRVNDVAVSLRNQASLILLKNTHDLQASLAQVRNVSVFVESGGTDFGNAYYFKFQVTTSAKKAGHFANFTENHYFTKASVKVGHDRLVFVISLHHAGRNLSGIMEATAFAELETVSDSNQVAGASSTFVICANDPFVFTHMTVPGDIEQSFNRWLDAAFAIGLSEFGDRI